ncbi:MAG: 50S ribosomal protein L6 [Dehalococcoidia bacterium]|nr:50S ribosomal protein L6 [Dehalococcoidia bacterium]
MSRTGRKPVVIPQGVQADIAGAQVKIKGPKGELSRTFDPLVKVTSLNGVITVERANDEKKTKALHGLTRALINNMVVGVTEGYSKTLDIVGVGYRVAALGKGITLQVGKSHPVIVEPLPGVTFQVEGQNRIHIRGANKEHVGLQAANIRKVRPPDLYKGKGIRYAGEVVRLKPGKGGKKA